MVSRGITCVWTALWSGVAVVSSDDWHPIKGVIIKTPRNKIKRKNFCDTLVLLNIESSLMQPYNAQ